MSIAIINRDVAEHVGVIGLGTNRFAKEQSFASSVKERVTLAM